MFIRLISIHSSTKQCSLVKLSGHHEKTGGGAAGAVAAAADRELTEVF